jgi:hypothetical protein
MTLTSPEISTSPSQPDVRAPISDEEYARLKERFHDDSGNYDLLRGERQKLFRGNWDTDYTLEQYVKETDHLIGLMDGSITERYIADPDDPERSQERPDVVIWLDKSARPVSWFADAFWEQFAKPDAEKPSYEFLNIDRVNWFVFMGYDRQLAESRLSANDFNINDLPQSRIDGIRAIFSEGELDEEHWQEQVWQDAARLDGKNILVIDEVMNRGGTLAIATQVLKRAFPTATVSGDYFWRPPRHSINGYSSDPIDMQMGSAPVWYDPDSSYGRGIGEVDIRYWNHLYEQEPTQETLKTRLGGYALSAPLFEAGTFDPKFDQKAAQLQQDIAYLSYAVADGRVLRRPDRARSAEDWDDILGEQGVSIREQREFGTRRQKDLRL